ncbi:hypothetical protein TrVE_jg6614 [Triparma verrucosa]|uniref:PPIase cyclophilin-type domain-containing protein n=1 Tax=Triparma verrucosa TaxID=1606542 RepID=A0A9W7EXR0_9STRA|nr:hypothetical protein TrVE_jg6614 [Triparma verrucosa]
MMYSAPSNPYREKKQSPLVKPALLTMFAFAIVIMFHALLHHPEAVADNRAYQAQTEPGLRSAAGKNSGSNSAESMAGLYPAGPPPTVPFNVMMLLADLNDGTEEMIVFTVDPAWAPKAAAHFKRLVEAKFYDGCKLYTVLPGFAIQTGINGNPAVQKKWEKVVLEEDPVVRSNEKGTLSFSADSDGIKNTPFFFTIGDMPARSLDKKGFTPFARMISLTGKDGMPTLEERAQNKYRQKPEVAKIKEEGNAYLDREFPGMTYIKEAKVLR